MMKKNLPDTLYTSDQVRELDRRAIEDHAIPGIVLMKRAGRAAFETILLAVPDFQKWVVVCGSGNNAGDGLIVAGIAASQKIPVEVLVVSDPALFKGSAAQAYDFALQEGVRISAFDECYEFCPDEVVIDALLGIGLRGKLREHYGRVIDTINNAESYVVSLDIPSGLNADTGAVHGRAVKADLTITFIACKRGLFTGAATGRVGQVSFASLDLPDSIYGGITNTIRRIDASDIPPMPERPEDSHKGLFGHVMVLGGDTAFGGAAIMAAESSLAAGAGLVSLATRPEHVAAALVRRPEIMAMGIKVGQDLEPWLERATVLVVGPGLGRSSWSEQCLQKSLDTNLPIVLDADGLNVLAALLSERKDRGHWVLTPHPGEAARLLGVTTQDIQKDRFSAVRAIQARYGGVVVLKGAGTLIASDQGTVLASVGTPALATAGSGDILSGVIGSLVAQGLSLFDAAMAGVCIHGSAGDMASKRYSSIYATELTPAIRQILAC